MEGPPGEKGLLRQRMWDASAHFKPASRLSTLLAECEWSGSDGRPVTQFLACDEKSEDQVGFLCRTLLRLTTGPGK
jgi:hypothetical protein